MSTAYCLQPSSTLLLWGKSGVGCCPTVQLPADVAGKPVVLLLENDQLIEPVFIKLPQKHTELEKASDEANHTMKEIKKNLWKLHKNKNKKETEEEEEEDETAVKLCDSATFAKGGASEVTVEHGGFTHLVRSPGVEFT
eukprot:m51a1_g13508 hypothetical protein (139) ;mRNA; f:834-2032